MSHECTYFHHTTEMILFPNYQMKSVTGIWLQRTECNEWRANGMKQGLGISFKADGGKTHLKWHGLTCLVSSYLISACDALICSLFSSHPTLPPNQPGSASLFLILSQFSLLTFTSKPDPSFASHQNPLPILSQPIPPSYHLPFAKQPPFPWLCREFIIPTSPAHARGLWKDVLPAPWPGWHPETPPLKPGNYEKAKLSLSSRGMK